MMSPSVTSAGQAVVRQLTHIHHGALKHNTKTYRVYIIKSNNIFLCFTGFMFHIL